jgi:hypothetical protein
MEEMALVLCQEVITVVKEVKIQTGETKFICMSFDGLWAVVSFDGSKLLCEKQGRGPSKCRYTRYATLSPCGKFLGYASEIGNNKSQLIVINTDSKEVVFSTEGGYRVLEFTAKKG